jgi:hypothetical protein
MFARLVRNWKSSSDGMLRTALKRGAWTSLEVWIGAAIPNLTKTEKWDRGKHKRETPKC